MAKIDDIITHKVSLGGLRNHISRRMIIFFVLKKRIKVVLLAFSLAYSTNFKETFLEIIIVFYKVDKMISLRSLITHKLASKQVLNSKI